MEDSGESKRSFVTNFGTGICIFIGSFVKRIAKDAANVTPDKPVKIQFWKSSTGYRCKYFTYNQDLSLGNYSKVEVAVKRRRKGVLPSIRLCLMKSFSPRDFDGTRLF